LQPDTLIPGVDSPQSWNRFSYTLNNPIRFKDPTGHAISCDAEVDCKEARADDKLSVSEYVNKKLSKYKVKISDGFSNTQSIAILSAVVKVGEKFASERGLGESGSTAFRATFGYINFKFEGSTGSCGSTQGVNSGGCTRGDHDVSFWSMSGQLYNGWSRMMKNVVHEIGHVYDNSLGGVSSNLPLDTQTIRSQVLLPNRAANGELSPNHYEWQQHPPAMDEAGWSGSETFGDIFIAWTYNAWNTGNGPEADNNISIVNNWMNGLIPNP